MTTATLDMRKAKRVAGYAWTLVYIAGLWKLSLPWVAISLIVANGFVREALKR